MRPGRTGGLAGLGLAALACTARGPEPEATVPPPTVTEPAATREPAVAAAPAIAGPRRSCKASAPASQQALSRVGGAVTIDGRTFAPAWRGTGAAVETVIVALDADGGLVVTPVPVPYADPRAIGGDAGGLVIVTVPNKGTGRLLRVALGEDGQLRPGTSTRLPEVAWGWPQELFLMKGRAVLVHTLATKEQSLGTTVLHTIDVAAGRVLASETLLGRGLVRCDADGCTTVTIMGAEAQVARGGREATLAIGSTCPAVYAIAGANEQVFVVPGDPWRALRVAGTKIETVAIDEGLAPMPGCGTALYEFPSTARPGLIEGTRTRTLLRWDARRGVFGARERLPDPGFDRTALADHPDGVIEVGWTGWRGMTHSPTDSRGMRRYYEAWSFDGGQVALLRHADGAWTAIDAAPLALAHAEGTFHDGYMPTILRHGLHAAVLLAPEGGGDPAWFQPFLRPCG